MSLAKICSDEPQERDVGRIQTLGDTHHSRRGATARRFSSRGSDHRYRIKDIGRRSQIPNPSPGGLALYLALADNTMQTDVAERVPCSGE